MGRHRWLVLTVAVLLVGSASAAGLARRSADRTEALPIFDAHMHFSEDAVERYSVDEVVAMMRDAKLRGVLVSSSGNEGTYLLAKAAPDLVILGLRPYRGRGETATWLHDPTTIDYLNDQLSRHTFVTLGEFHVYGADADLPVMQSVVDLAREHGLILHAHADVAAIERIYACDPAARVLWAHAGFASPVEVRGLLSLYPTLNADLAFRTDYYAGTKVEPEWRRLFVDLPDRFMVGSDTYTPERIPRIVDHANASRGWLRDLPEVVAEKMAYKNAERILGKPEEG